MDRENNTGEVEYKIHDTAAGNRDGSDDESYTIWADFRILGWRRRRSCHNTHRSSWPAKRKSWLMRRSDWRWR